MGHRSLEEGQNHKIQDFLYTSQTDLEAASFAATDIGKVARVSEADWNTYWIIINNTGPVLGFIDSSGFYTTQTTNATETSVATISLNDEESYFITVKAICQLSSAATDQAVLTKSALYYRTSAGNATLEGSIATDKSIKSSGFGTIDTGFTVSGSDIDIEVQGVAATTINWKVFINIIKAF